MATVVIMYDGIDITPYVMFSSARFESAANGLPGTFTLRIKDERNVSWMKPSTFIVGHELTLDIDGSRVWGGYLMRAARAYAFSAEDTTAADRKARFWELTGADYNLLFLRRVMLNKAAPNKPLPVYPMGTNDQTMILDFVANFLDLGGDGIDTGGVNSLGVVNPYEEFTPANPGDQWGQAMGYITQVTRGMFYIDPDKVLRYVDVETATAPHVLCDQPASVAGSIGYREMQISSSATELGNDALIWGTGLGASTVHFQRVKDQASIDLHGLFQFGEFRHDMFKDLSLRRRADSYVNGSPQSHRGHKDDLELVRLTHFQPGFRVSQVADFRSLVFGYSRILPIRGMVVTFPTPTDVQYELTLGHDYDAAYATVDKWWDRWWTERDPGKVMWIDTFSRVRCDPGSLGVADNERDEVREWFVEST